MSTIIATRNNHGIVIPYLVDTAHGDDPGKTADRSHAVTDPLGTITSKRSKGVCLPFFVQYNGTGTAQPVTRPLTTITSKARQGLAICQLMDDLGIVDIGFRMLDESELARAQGFPEGYSFYGTKEHVIRMIGNAVCPGVMKALCAAIGKAS